LRDTDPHGLDMVQEGVFRGSSSFGLEVKGLLRRKFPTLTSQRARG
jgi:hypothetical protein